MGSIQDFYVVAISKYLKTYKWMVEEEEAGLIQFLSLKTNNRILLDFNKESVSIDYYEKGEVYNGDTYNLEDIREIIDFLTKLQVLGETLS